MVELVKGFGRWFGREAAGGVVGGVSFVVVAAATLAVWTWVRGLSLPRAILLGLVVAVGLALVLFLISVAVANFRKPIQTTAAATGEYVDAYVHQRLTDQQYGIHHFVEIRDLKISQHDLMRENPYLEFKVSVSPKSVYPLAIDDLDGSIRFDGRLLSETPRLLPEPGGDLKVNLDTRFIIRQKLTKGDVTRILNESAEFDFQEVSVRIYSSNEKVKSQRLPIQRRWSKIPVSNAEILTAHPKLKIAVSNMTATMIVDLHTWNARTPDAIVSLALSLTNPRPTTVFADMFELALTVKGETHTATAEKGAIWEKKRINKDGTVEGLGKQLNNLADKTPIRLSQALGGVQFVLPEIGAAVLNNPFTYELTIIDTSGEKHSLSGTGSGSD